MRDIPIIFSAPMVRALLDGRKTQTRHLVPQPPAECGINYMLGEESWLPIEKRTPVRRAFEAWTGPLFQNRPPGHLCGSFDITPRFQPRDRLWVRENWKPHSSFAGTKPRDMPAGEVFYMADGGYAPSNTPWVPCIHMPRWASRLTLLVEQVRIERLQDISEKDAKAEGVTADEDPFWRPSATDPDSGGNPSHRTSFECLWNSINGADAWDANPWVVALTFRVIRSNIDAIPSQEAA